MRDAAYAKLLQLAHREPHCFIVQDDPKTENLTFIKRPQFHETNPGYQRWPIYTSAIRKGVCRLDLRLSWSKPTLASLL